MAKTSKSIFQPTDSNMDSSQSSSIEPSSMMEVADRDGDVILVVGTENPVSIRVSSKILTLVSPVFAAMLGPNFLEGSKLSTTQPYQLRLPEDDAEAVVWFCLILHFQRSIDDYISLSLFEKLALLCNKYDSACALSSWSKAWLHRVNTLPKDQLQYERLLYTSYVYGIHESFWISSKAFLLNGLTTYSDAVERPDLLTLGLALLPDSLLDSINHDREEIILSLLQTIENLIQPYLEMQTLPGSCDDPLRMQEPSDDLNSAAPFHLNNSLPRAQRQDVCLRFRRVTHYFRELLRIGLWPMTRTMRGSTIKSILDRLKQYQNLPGDFELFGRNPRCECIRINFRQSLGDAAENAEKTLKGLCLLCVQNGRLSPRDGNCQATHRSLCSAKGRSTTRLRTRSIVRDPSVIGTEAAFGNPGPYPTPSGPRIESILSDPSIFEASDVSTSPSAFRVPTVSEIPRLFGGLNIAGYNTAIANACRAGSRGISENNTATWDPSASGNQSVSGNQNTTTAFGIPGASTTPSVSGTRRNFGARRDFGTPGISRTENASTTSSVSVTQNIPGPATQFGIPAPPTTPSVVASPSAPSTSSVSGNQSIFGTQSALRADSPTGISGASTTPSVHGTQSVFRADPPTGIPGTSTTPSASGTPTLFGTQSRSGTETVIWNPGASTTPIVSTKSTSRTPSASGTKPKNIFGFLLS